MLGGRELFPKPWTGQIEIHGITVRKVELGRDGADFDTAIIDGVLPDGGTVRIGGEVFAQSIFGGIEDNRPVGTQDAVVVEDEGD